MRPRCFSQGTSEYSPVEEAEIQLARMWAQVVSNRRNSNEFACAEEASNDRRAAADEKGKERKERRGGSVLL